MAPPLPRSPLSAPSDPVRPAPRPIAEDHQRDQDVTLAQSMTSVPVRVRSTTLVPQSELQTPLRPDRASTGGSASGTGILGTSPPGGGESTMLGRRRVSVGAMNAMDHLADDLEVQEVQQAQRDQDHVFFDRGSTSPQMRQAFIDRQQQSRFGPTHPSQQQSPSMHHSAAAARFYRHRRNMSDSSIDSQGGAYIDHRRQPHSLSSGIVPRSVYASGGSGAGGRGADRYVGRSATTGGTFRRDGGEDASEGGRPRSPGSPTHTRDDPSQSGISNATLQQQHPHLTTEDLDENAFLDDDEALSPRVRLERQASRRSYISDLSHHSREDHIGGTFSNELSRQGSPLGNPQEDVCFPAHGATGDSDLLDIGMSEMYGGIEHQELHHQSMIHEHHHAHGGHLGVPGVLQNYPFGFDFGALEEFAEREKEGIPIPGTRNRAKRMSDAVFSTSPPDYGTSASAATRGGHLDESGARRTMRQRKLSESVAPGRFQRKLAMFEGTGEEGPPPPRASGRARGGLGSILDVKTPLLTTKNSSNGYGSGKGSTPAPGGTARPYRFSFYSNSLPSTIHARSLAEIPAEGQTFEDLFVGHNSDYDESVSGTDPQMAFSPAAQTDTGAHTPSFSNRAPSSNGGGGGGGSTMPGMGGGGSRKSEKTARPSGMRTEMDAESNTWWLDVLCPTDQEMKVLSKVFGIHPLTTEDILMEETREKIELFRNYYFVCFRSFEQDPYSPTYLEPLNMYIIVFREGTLSFHFRGAPHPQNVRRRIKQLKDYINVTSDWISYALIDDITDAFGPLIQNIEYEVDSIDELVLILKEAEQSDMLRRIGTCRKKVMGLLRLMGNKADVVKGLSKRCNENWSVAPKSDIGLYLSDIQDHITTSTQNLTHYEKILSRSHSNYLAQISIEMTDANNEINNVLSKLTALGTVLIPMNLVTGLWGMNVHVPGQDADGLTWFFSIIGCLGAIALGGAWMTYRVFNK